MRLIDEIDNPHERYGCAAAGQLRRALMNEMPGVDQSAPPSGTGRASAMPRMGGGCIWAGARMRTCRLLRHLAFAARDRALEGNWPPGCAEL
jgi:hypothetical protein